MAFKSAPHGSYSHGHVSLYPGCNPQPSDEELNLEVGTMMDGSDEGTPGNARGLPSCGKKTEEHYQSRLTVQCVEMIFEQTQVPTCVVDEVMVLGRRYGLWAAIAAADCVLCAFEEGLEWGKYEAAKEAREHAR